MSFVRFAVLVSTVAFATSVGFAQPEEARSDDPTALHNWSIPFSAMHRATSAAIRETSALPSAASHFIEMAPCRVYDSRVVAGGPGPIASGTSRTVPISGGPCAGIPATAAGFSLNFTVTNSPSGSGYAYLTAYPAGTTRPNVATVNFRAGAQVGNAAIVAAGAGAAIDVYVSLQTEVIVDVNGYFAEGVVTSVIAGMGMTGGGSGDVNVSIADGGVGTAQLSATGSTAGQVLASTGSAVQWETMSGATGAAGGDLSGTYPNPAVATVSGQSAASVASGAVLANAATSLNTPAVIVKRDPSGNFSAGTITASLNGNAATATSFSGALAGEVTGTQGATVVSNAVPVNTASAIVRRDGMGSFSAATVTLSGGLQLPTTASASAGAITIGGMPFLHNYGGTTNTFVGASAGNFTMTGAYNTGSGTYALTSNTTGQFNAAIGFNTLRNNTGGSWNTAGGYQALAQNTTGNANTAAGHDALSSNTTGSNNTAYGSNALLSNTGGGSNTAIGTQALTNTTGGGNIGIGANGGHSLTTGNFNIDIGNAGVAAESSTIRIGDAGQTRTFIAGIRGVTTGSADAVTVYIDSNGQLGTVSSSRRTKFDIEDMGPSTDGLLRLRPVKFRYVKYGPDGPLQYGLIAEEVGDVYPELVARGRDGQVETVLYQFLAPMLLNEVQKQERSIEGLQAENADLRARLDRLEKILGGK